MSAIVTVWKYGTHDWDGTPVPRPLWSLSGLSPAGPQEWVDQIQRVGHAITEVGQRPSNHHVIGVGVGHNDAAFAEAGRSMAAYYENEGGIDGRWWDDNHPVFGVGPRYYGTTPDPR
jgi:hypothetical protein